MSSSAVDSRRLALIVLASLGLSVVFFAPRLWLMRHYLPGTFQWERAHAFLLQCEDPFRRDIEPAMLWRLLPPLVCHTLRLPGLMPLALPWLGIVATTGYVAILCRRRFDDWRFVAGGTLLFATTSAVLVPVGWLGINDAWVWLGLLAVAFSRARWALPLACLLGPWVDERFIIGFPLAWLVRLIDRGEGWRWRALLDGLWLMPYAALRLWLSRADPAASQAADIFIGGAGTRLHVLLPIAPLGWWLGLRAAWVAIFCAGLNASRRQNALVAVTAVLTAVVSVALASDLSRSIAVEMPLIFFGCFAFARDNPAQAPRALLLLAIANLLIPAAHMSYTKIDPINPLPIELFRLLRPQ